MNTNTFIHPTASIHPTAVIHANVTIEKNVRIGAYCIVGAPAERSGKWESKGVTINEGAILHGLNTVDAGTERRTQIGKNTQLLKQAHVGHDALIGNNCVLSCGSRIGGHATINHYCNIGLNASVHQWLEVPVGVMLGMNSCLTKKADCKKYEIWAGVPARYIKENKVLKQRLGI